VLFKEARFLETMAKADVLLLDKTGTITEGKPEVISHRQVSAGDVNLLYALVQGSNHPISKGIVRYLQAHHDKFSTLTLEGEKQIEAKGIEAYHQGKRLLGGSVALFEGFEMPEEEGSVFIFAIDGEVRDVFVLQDRIKAGAKETISQMQTAGIEVVMLTGDHEKIAQKIAKEVGITSLKHSLLPQDKLDVVDAYHDKGKIVIMAGDGINDALALSKSDVAIAMGSGADVSIDVSDVVLLDDSMTSLSLAWRLSQKTYTNIKQNLALSLLYNLITIPLAVMGFVIPLIAALSMSLSSLIVVANAVRIKRGF
jgi:Cu+-exporting ATPase